MKKLTATASLAIGLIAGCTLVGGCSLASDSVRRITAAELKVEIDAGRALIIDVRSASSYAQEHIEGAVHIPYATVDKAAGELPKEKLIATYCS